MTRPSSSSGASKAPGPQTSDMPQPMTTKSTPTSSTTAKSPRNTSNRIWVHERQKRKFLHHLTQWSLDHDSSLHFHGRISLLPRGTRRAEDLELGKAVTCVLTDTTFTDARQTIIIKLFPPQEKVDVNGHEDARRDSMDPGETRSRRYQYQTDGKSDLNPTSAPKGRECYKMVVRCGAGWMSAREYLNKVYFSHLEAQQDTRRGRLTQDEYLKHRSQALGPPPSEKESVIIRPLFHSYRKLPPELQEMVLMTAAGLSRSYNLCSDDYGLPRVRRERRSAISFSTLCRISKGINQNLLPYVYHSTDFHFGLTGYGIYALVRGFPSDIDTSFTNFLWQSGPTKRHELRRLTFHFGKLALLHCIRWLAPDPVFSLFEPPVATNPRSLQYFWRCQIQDLVKDLNLFTLTIDIRHIAVLDIPMIVAILKGAFGSIEHIHFIETDKNGVTTTVDLNDERLGGLTKKHTWKDTCVAYYETHRSHTYFFKFDLLRGQVQDLEASMAEDEKFFDTVIPPLSAGHTLRGV
jgi:hypothetical protein